MKSSEVNCTSLWQKLAKEAIHRHRRKERSSLSAKRTSIADSETIGSAYLGRPERELQTNLYKTWQMTLLFTEPLRRKLTPSDTVSMHLAS